MTTLEVENRHAQGKGTARKLRAQGKLPGVVYGPTMEPVSVACDPAALVDIFAETGNRNTLVQLTINGEAVSCLVREVQRHPLSREIVHVDFYRVAEDRRVEVMIPVRPVGRPKGAILGGRLRLVRRELEALCFPQNIPEVFEIDATPMDIGDIVRAGDLKLPEGVVLTAHESINVLTCYGKKRGPNPDLGVVAAEGEGEAEAEAEGGEA